MKENKAEKLYLALSEADDDLLREAEETDSREKLNGKGGADSGKIRRKRIVRTVSALAACLAVVLTVTFVAPLLKNDTIPAWITEEVGGKLDCFDAVNYYGAKTLLMREAGIDLESAGTVKQTAFLPAPPSFRFLSAAGTEEETEFFGDEETKSDEDIYYYEIDPNKRFRITKVIAFQIGLTDPEGFLAKRLGTGIVDVVITESNLEIMITFHAHGKYYTCLMNGGGKTNYQFSTHKYIEGFHIVKNFEQVNYAFAIDIAEGHVTGLTCSGGYGYGSDCPPDRAFVVEGSDYMKKVNGSFTVPELEGIISNLPPESAFVPGKEEESV